MLRGMTGEVEDGGRRMTKIILRYRQTVIHNLPQLEKLDNVNITSEERVRMMMVQILVEGFCFFQADARFGITLEKEEVMEDTLGQRRISLKVHNTLK